MVVTLINGYTLSLSELEMSHGKKAKGAKGVYSTDTDSGLTIEEVWQKLRAKLVKQFEDGELLLEDYSEAADLEDVVFEEIHNYLVGKNTDTLPKADMNFLMDASAVLYRELSSEPEEEEDTGEEVQHYVHWVGGKFHSRESFIDEWRRLGVSIRVGRLPEDLSVGKSRIYLVSDLSLEERQKYLTEQRRKKRERRKARKEGRTVSFKDSPVLRGKSEIFAWFVIKSVVFIVGPDKDVPEELKKRGVKVWEYKDGEFGFNDERACGSLVIGGTYILSEEDMEKVKDLADDTQLESQNIHLLDPTVPWKGGRFRGLKRFEGLPTEGEK